MEYIVVCIVTIVLELALCWLINKREPEYMLSLKKYGVLFGAGNVVLMCVANFLEYLGWHPAIWYFGLCSYLFCLTVYDLKFKELPDWYHLVLLLFYCYLFVTLQLPYTILNGVTTAVVVGAVLMVVYLIKKDAIGIGDMKVAIVCSQYVAIEISAILVRAMLVAFLFSIVLLLLKKVDKKTGLPFIPFLFIGALFM